MVFRIVNDPINDVRELIDQKAGMYKLPLRLGWTKALIGPAGMYPSRIMELSRASDAFVRIY